MKRILQSSVVALSIALLANGTAAMAQDQASADAGQADAVDMAADEIVVTAQKREERAKDIPISISAFGGEALSKANITDVLEVERLVPNFNVTRGAQTSNIRINIRGIGASGNTGVDPSVASFINGVYVARPGAVLGRLFDVSAVEVLRGPQGTLFGRNATVGAFVVRTQNPTDAFEGSLSASYGNYGEKELQGFVNLPIAEGAGLRVAAIGAGLNGYGRTLVGNHRYGDQDNYGARATLSLEPAANVKWLLRADYMKVSGDGATQVEVLPSSVTATAKANLIARTGNRVPDLTNAFDRVVNQSVFGDLNDRQWGLVSDLAWEAPNGITLKLINGYRTWKNDQIDGDFGFLPLDALSRVGSYRSKAQSHELQFISPSKEWLDGKLDLVAGLYYFKEDYAITEQFSFLQDFCGLIPNLGVRAACNADPKDPATANRFFQTAESFAAYGQSTYRLTDTVSATLGGRFTKDKKSGGFDQTLYNRAGALLRSAESARLKFDDDQFTWRAVLDWKPRPGALFYASYSTGYKSGGFNSGGGTIPLLNRRIFQSETVKNYELGSKVDWLDNLLTTNLTLFRMDIGGFQDRTFDGTSFVVNNAGSLRQQGVEAEAIARPLRGLRLNASLAYLDSEFTSYPAATGLPGFGGTQNLTGKRANYSPKWQGSLGAQYEGDLGATGLKWALRGDYRFYGDQSVSATTDNNPQAIQDAYGLLSATFTISEQDDRWSVGLYGENLGQTGYCREIVGQPLAGPLGVLDSVTGGVMQRCLPGAPRTYGVKAGIRF